MTLFLAILTSPHFSLLWVEPLLPQKPIYIIEASGERLASISLGIRKKGAFPTGTCQPIPIASGLCNPSAFFFPFASRFLFSLPLVIIVRNSSSFIHQSLRFIFSSRG
jgi:hypothetical protein